MRTRMMATLGVAATLSGAVVGESSAQSALEVPQIVVVRSVIAVAPGVGGTAERERPVHVLARVDRPDLLDRGARVG